MYETILHALVPPKEYNMCEFDEEIKNRIRPGFFNNIMGNVHSGPGGLHTLEGLSGISVMVYCIAIAVFHT